jgi:hypothetical protein
MLLEDELLDILILARRLPCKDDVKNYKRIGHVLTHGHLVVLKVDGEIKGFAECYRMKEIPSFPVMPLPVDDPDGKILYCWSAACERNFIRQLIELGKYNFQTCTHICWHTHRRKNALHLERIGD